MRIDERIDNFLNESSSNDLWLARDKDDTLVLSIGKPRRDRDFGWLQGKKDTYIFLPEEWFPEVKSDEEQPRRIRVSL